MGASCHEAAQRQPRHSLKSALKEWPIKTECALFLSATLHRIGVAGPRSPVPGIHRRPAEQVALASEDSHFHDGGQFLGISIPSADSVAPVSSARSKTEGAAASPAPVATAPARKSRSTLMMSGSRCRICFAEVAAGPDPSTARRTPRWRRGLRTAQVRPVAHLQGRP